MRTYLPLAILKDGRRTLLNYAPTRDKRAAVEEARDYLSNNGVEGCAFYARLPRRTIVCGSACLLTRIRTVGSGRRAMKIPEALFDQTVDEREQAWIHRLNRPYPLSRIRRDIENGFWGPIDEQAKDVAREAVRIYQTLRAEFLFYGLPEHKIAVRYAYFLGEARRQIRGIRERDARKGGR